MGVLKNPLKKQQDSWIPSSQPEIRQLPFLHTAEDLNYSLERLNQRSLNSGTLATTENINGLLTENKAK